MNKKIRCGLLIETQGGVPKKIGTEDGGGTRFCIWDKKDLMFSEIHRRFRKIFELRRHYRTSVYDFRHRPINFKRYATFGHYIDEHGLSGRSTVIFLYVHNSDVDKSRMTMMKKEKTLPIKIPNSSAFKENELSSSSTTYSSVTSVQAVNHQQVPRSSLGNQLFIID